MRPRSRRFPRDENGAEGFGGLLRSSSWLVAGAALSRGTMLLAWVLVARTVVPADFGKLNLMQTAITLLSGLAGMGLALAVTRQVAEARELEPEAAGRYLGTALLLTVAGGLVMTVALVVGRHPFAEVLLHDRGLGNLVVASAGAVAFYALTLAIQAALMGLESFKGVALSQLVQGTAAGAGLVLGASEHGALGALIGFSVGQALAAAAAFLLLHHALAARSLAVSYRLERAVLRPLWRLGVPTFIAFVTVSSAILAGQVLLSHQHRGYEQVAIFTAAYRWHLAILFVPAAVAPLLVPVMTRLAAAARGPRLRSLFQRSVAGTLLLAAVPALVVALAAPLVLGLSGDFYAHHSLPLVLLAAAAIPAALNNVLSGTSVSLGAVRAWLVSDVVLALVLVGAGALLIASMQASGLALAYLGAYVATDAVLAVPLVRRLRPAGTPT